MLTNVSYKNLSIIQIKRKQAAFVELFGQDPVIYVKGIFTDTSGNAVFLTSSVAQVKKIGRKNLTLWLHSDSEPIVVSVPHGGTEFEFSF
jgi:hypothetical protein